MRIDRNWIVLVLAVLLIVSVGCSKKTPDVEPPPVDTTPTAPPQDVRDQPAVAEPADPTPPPVPESIQEINRRITAGGLVGDVLFDTDKYDLGAEAKNRLGKNADFMKGEGKDLRFLIEGHCDERGTTEYNLALGENRSNAARDYLVSLGVSASRLEIISYGEDRPVCNDSNEVCWKRNRRARFVVTERLR